MLEHAQFADVVFTVYVITLAFPSTPSMPFIPFVPAGPWGPIGPSFLQDSIDNAISIIERTKEIFIKKIKKVENLPLLIWLFRLSPVF
jgi:hypothetical protein